MDRGRVVKVEGDLAQVEFEGSPECARCGACYRSASGKMTIEADNPVGAKVGNEVEVEISPVAKIFLPFLVYGVPVIFLFIGMLFGNLVSETFSVIAGLAFLVMGIGVVRVASRNLSRKKGIRGRIVRRL